MHFFASSFRGAQQEKRALASTHRDRDRQKRDFRRLWITRINAVIHERGIFKENIKFIESFNKAKTQSYKLGVNKFTDLTNEEFRATMLNAEKGPTRPKPSKPASSSVNESLYEVPDYLDWREKGAVTNIKDQGHCD
nr:ribosomal protein L20 [Ipomoea batatas]